MKGTKWLGVSAGLAGLGLGVSVYLLLRTYALLYGDAVAGTDFCNIVVGASCDRTLEDETSWLLGIPVAGWGVVYFGGLISLMTMAWLMEELFYKEAVAGAVAANLAGLAVSAYLLYLIATGQAPLCPMCLVVHAANVTLFPFLLMASGSAPREVFQRIRRAFVSIVETGGAKGDPQRTWYAVGLLSAALIAVAVYELIFIQTQIRAAAAGDIKALGRTLEYIRDKKRIAVEIRPDDPRLGLRSAPIQMVVFSDLECPTCRELHPYYESLLDRFPEEITIIFKHFPLNSKCNPLLKDEKHPEACRAARTAEAAHRQGKFWEVHDAIFKAGATPIESAIPTWAEGIGLDSTQLLQDIDRQDVERRIQEDVEQGIKLDVRGTPTIFLNGRRIKDFERIEDEVLAESFLMMKWPAEDD